MKQKLFMTILLGLHISVGLAQSTGNSFRTVHSKLTIEPAIGTSLFGNDGLVFSTLLQVNTEKKLSFISHTSFAPGLMTFMREDVGQNYAYMAVQKVGIGASYHTRRIVHSYSLLAGLKYNSYSGTLRNEQVVESITTKTRSITSDYGVMYNLKLGRGKYFFSTRVYVPLKDGIYGLGEDSNFEFGMGIHLKNTKNN